MPYKKKSDLPDKIRNKLPGHAQAIYKEAFNHAYTEYKDPKKRKDDSSQEEVAHKVAWSAVKKKYKKDTKTGKWKIR